LRRGLYSLAASRLIWECWPLKALDQDRVPLRASD
jgi:hypothetical protein